MADKIPQTLTDICDYLKNEKESLHQFGSSDDGRIDSSIMEDSVIQRIKSQFNIIVPKKRDWYDCAIEEDIFIPVNIKITKTTKADNLNCKLGVYYALTGVKPDFHNEIDWLSFFEELRKDLGEGENDDLIYLKDYYFLILNKEDNQDIFCAKLKGLKKLQQNGSNLPFQCKWKDNKEVIDRSFQEARDFILSNLSRSIKLRTKIYCDFKKNFPQYVAQC